MSGRADLGGRADAPGLVQALAQAVEAPWCWPLRPAIQTLLPALAGGCNVAEVLNTLHTVAADGARRFVPQQALPAGEAYEAFIRRSGDVPSRDNLHDLFNGLIWWSQPALKARMNALQAAEIARAGIGARRGPMRDALTLMDENGALLDAPAPLWAALQARDWQALFVRHRALWREARLVIVGHALLEQLALVPRKPLTAHVLRAADPLALDEAGWAAKPFCPLPVLGVPGWWPANEDPAFYRDTAVFRPLRTSGLRAAEVVYADDGADTAQLNPAGDLARADQSARCDAAAQAVQSALAAQVGRKPSIDR